MIPTKLLRIWPFFTVLFTHKNLLSLEVKKIQLKDSLSNDTLVITRNYIRYFFLKFSSILTCRKRIYFDFYNQFLNIIINCNYFQGIERRKHEVYIQIIIQYNNANSIFNTASINLQDKKQEQQVKISQRNLKEMDIKLLNSQKKLEKRVWKT